MTASVASGAKPRIPIGHATATRWTPVGETSVLGPAAHPAGVGLGRARFFGVVHAAMTSAVSFRFVTANRSITQNRIV